MSSTFIGYKNTVNFRKNIDLFMGDNMNNIMNLHKQQFEDEEINQNSIQQYNVMLYYAALEYCVNLYFIILENTEDESITNSEVEYKELYKFKDIKFNLAHYNVDLNTIYETVKITHTTTQNEITLDRSSYIDYGYIDTDMTNFAVRVKFAINELTNEDIVIASFNEYQTNNIINANNTYGIKIYYDASSKRIYARVSNSVYVYIGNTSIYDDNRLINDGGDVDFIFWIDYNYNPYPRYGFAVNGQILNNYDYEDEETMGMYATWMGTAETYSFKLNTLGKTILGGIYNGSDILSNGSVSIKHFEVAPFSVNAVHNMIDGINNDTSVFRIDASNNNTLQDEVNSILPIDNTSDII